MGVAAAVGKPRNGGTHHVADGKDEGTRILGQPDGRQGVGGFTGLRNGNHHVILVDDRLAVAEFAAVLHLHRNPGKLLDAIHGDQAGMPGGAAGGDDDALGIQETLPVVNESGKCDAVPVNVHPAAHGDAERLRLLKNLLEHEMGKTALFQLVEGDFQFFDFRGLAHVGDGGDYWFLPLL